MCCQDDDNKFQENNMVLMTFWTQHLADAYVVLLGGSWADHDGQQAMASALEQDASSVTMSLATLLYSF